MELDFTDDQEELREAIRAVLVKESPITLARAVVEDGTRATALWDTVVGLGWPALTVPEQYGGIGLGAVEAAILAEECGRMLTPGPLFPTVMQFVPALLECGDDAQRARWLGAVATGECSGSLALCDADGSYDLAGVATTCTVAGDELVLSGTKRYVFEADAVDELVVVARAPGTTGDDGLCAVVVPAAAVRTHTVNALDESRRLVHVELADVRVAKDRALTGASAPALRRAMEEATVALALEMVGAAQAAFDVTIEYAKQRVQFGVPIGSFQATKHKFADMLIVLERARSTGYFAALTLAEDDDRRARATAVAKVAAGDCQRMLAKEGIQIHGGIGYTWEHDMHLYVKRMKSSEQLFGTSADHRARLASMLGV
jgi:alkylation response protein AidB-like acyl-CoA dehydrogenase